MRSHAAVALSHLLAPAAARWTARRERDILRTGLPLPDEFVGFARSLGIRDIERIRIEQTDLVPVPLPRHWLRLARRLGLPVFFPVGMTLGYGISVSSNSPRLIRHELVHVLQFERLGGHLPFLHRYLGECFNHGYRNAPLEIEARHTSCSAQAFGKRTSNTAPPPSPD